MRLPDQKVAEIERAREGAFRAGRSIPFDHLEWRPMERGHSVLDMLRELAKTPDWAYYVLTDTKPEDPEGAAEAQRVERAAWRTVDDCEAACREKLERLYGLYRRLSDDDLRRRRWLPFNGGREHTYGELLDYPRWNFAYHHGQIAYIESLIDPKRVSCIYSLRKR